MLRVIRLFILIKKLMFLVFDVPVGQCSAAALAEEKKTEKKMSEFLLAFRISSANTSSIKNGVCAN